MPFRCISATVEQTHNDNSFYVGDKIKQEDIHGKFEDGILRLFIPKVSQVEQKNLIAIEG